MVSWWLVLLNAKFIHDLLKNSWHKIWSLIRLNRSRKAYKCEKLHKCFNYCLSLDISEWNSFRKACDISFPSKALSNKVEISGSLCCSLQSCDLDSWSWPWSFEIEGERSVFDLEVSKSAWMSEWLGEREFEISSLKDWPIKVSVNAMSCIPSFCLAFFATALVTAHEGQRSGISCSMGSCGSSTQWVLVKNGSKVGLQYVSSGFRCRVITGSLMMLY